MVMRHQGTGIRAMLRIALLALIVPTLIAACGTTKPATEKTLVVGTNIGYPPFEQYASNGKTLVGVDVDIMNAIGAALHDHVRFVNASFDSLIPSLAAGRYTAVISALSDTPSREKVVTFIDYFLAGGQVVVPAGNPKHVTGFSDLCGLTVGSGAGSSEYTQATQESTVCTKAGKPPITQQTYANGVAAVLALESGRINAALLDSGPAAYSVKTSNGKLQLAGSPFDVGPYGIAVEKSNTALVKAIERGLQAIMSNGTYHKILVKWGQTGGAVSHPTINDASLS